MADRIPLWKTVCMSKTTLKVAIEQRNGIPEIVINGESHSRLVGRSTLPDWLAVEKMTILDEAKVEVVFINSPHFILSGWDGADGYDYTVYDWHVRRFIERDPKVKLILFTGAWIAAPWYWCKAHTDQLIHFNDGSRWCFPSLGSKIWKRDLGEALRRFVEHYEASPYANNIIGYNISHRTNEWGIDHRKGCEWHDSMDVQEICADFSPAMVSFFRDWLKNHYKGDVAALRRNWKHETVTFDSAWVPDVNERAQSTGGRVVGATGPMGTRWIDFQRCLIAANTDLALAMAKLVKDACGRRKLVGMMNAYSYNIVGGRNIIPKSDVPRLLASPDLDFFHSPYSYENRDFGTGTHNSQHAVSAVHARGKVMINQSDSNTHVVTPIINHLDPPNDDRSAFTEWESLQVMKRDVGYALQHHLYMYWLDGGPGKMFRWGSTGHGIPEYAPFWFELPAFKKLIGDLQQVMDENRRRGNPANAEVAWVSSVRSAIERDEDATFSSLLVRGLRQWRLPFVGAPFDDYVLEDFEAITKRYKVYIFPDAHSISSELRDKIRAKLKADNALAIWFYAPGYITDHQENVGGIEALTGIRAQLVPERDFIQMDPLSGDHPILEGLQGASFGSDVDYREFARECNWFQWPNVPDNYRFSPHFCVEDPDAVVLGRYRNLLRPGMAIKEADGFTSLFIGTPDAPSALLRNALKLAGVHLYSQQDNLVYANSGMLSVTFRREGSHTLSLPSRSRVIDALTGEVIADKVLSLSIAAAYGETRIFWLEPV